jgi:hypothetical protein
VGEQQDCATCLTILFFKAKKIKDILLAIVWH